MKILVLTNLFPPHGIGGYEERCLQTVRALRAVGHDVTVLTSNHAVEGRGSEEEPGLEVLRRLRVHGFYGHPWLPIHKLWRLEQANHEVLRETLESAPYDVVHVWNMGGISKSLLLRLERQPVPVVYDISDHWIARSLVADVWLSWWNRPGSAVRSAFRGLLTALGVRRWLDRETPTQAVETLRFERIYFCSEFMRDTTVAKGYPVGHADVIYCGVEVERFARKDAYGPVKQLLWVGRMAEDKDPLTALKGFLRARERSGADLTLHLYGRGDAAYRAELEAIVAGAGVPPGTVEFRSASHEEMKQLYAQYDAYIFSSAWGEPFALTPLEAMASGTPVLMCPDGGDAELADDGVNALVFEARNPESLATAIERFLALSDHGEALAREGLQQVHERYSVAVMAKRIEAYLRASVS